MTNLSIIDSDPCKNIFRQLFLGETTDRTNLGMSSPSSSLRRSVISREVRKEWMGDAITYGYKQERSGEPKITARTNQTENRLTSLRIIEGHVTDGESMTGNRHVELRILKFWVWIQTYCWFPNQAPSLPPLNTRSGRILPWGRGNPNFN